MRLVLGFSIVAISACAGSPTPAPPTLQPGQKSAPAIEVAHPTPERERRPLPATAVVLYDEPSSRFEADGLEIYQNTRPDFDQLPFIFLVDKPTWQKFATTLRAEGGLARTTTRFVVHWPGHPAGAETLCESDGSLVTLELARAVYEYVLPHFVDKDLSDPMVEREFLAMTESQINYVVYHEAEHIRHCRDGTARETAEQEARLAEAKRVRELGHVIYIRKKPGADIRASMNYVAKLRASAARKEK